MVPQPLAAVTQFLELRKDMDVWNSSLLLRGFHFFLSLFFYIVRQSFPQAGLELMTLLPQPEKY